MKERLSGFLFLIAITYTSILAAQTSFQEQVLSSLRSRMILNGSWQFQPAEGDKPGNDWGTIQVPGAWATDGTWWLDVPVVVKKGKTALWQTDLTKASKAWYRQTITVPKSWKGSAVELELERVATDAVVFVNGKKAGLVEWYAGKVDITPFVFFGASNNIELLVIATPEAGEVANLMGTAQEQVSFSKATLATRGITGDVILHRRPQGMHISDVFVKTSVRRSSIEPEIEVSGMAAVPSLQIINRVFDEKGKLVKTFSQKAILSSKAALQVVSTGSYWQNPKFWDLDQPRMYQLHTLIISNGKLVDEYVQEFGFREFWIDGKNFYLNGTRINLRPTLDPPGDGMGELIAASIDGIRNAGFNFAELWPTNFDQRGEIRDWREVMTAADKKGFLLSGVALPFSFYIVDRTFAHTWEKPGIKEKWEQRMVYELRKQRNHPSVIMWGSSANFFGHAQDQNPLHIGQSGWIKNNDFWQRNATAAQDAIQTIKKHDPTRPVFTHHGAYVGDVHTLNFYLSLTPLQEREEWLSHYSRFGKMPFMAIEFGTPLHCTFLRGRNGFGNNIRTEPLVTEFIAMYGGSEAYKQETDEYRSLIRKNFLGGQQYQPWSNPVEMERLPAFQQLQHLFSKNTWRSYRTWGISGGMVPWHRGHGWVPDTTVKGTVQMPAFNGGRKGFYFPEVDKKKLKYLQPSGWVTMPAGQAIMENNNDVLAYIAGGEHNFAAKDHHFQEGDRVSKQLLFFNDTRVPQTCRWEARAELGGKVLEQQSGTMLLPVGEKGTKSFWFQLPAGQKPWKQEGNILLTATINGKTLRDTFSFRSFRKSTEATNKEVVVFDPEGKTSFMLQSLGFTVKPWQGDSTVPFVVMGRNAMLLQYRHPASLEAYVRKGGKLLLMNQHPDSVAHKKGFRTSQFISRNVFLIDSLHPLVAGLDDSDFRNWTGESRLTEAYPDYVNRPVKKGASEIPYYGWHWGNQGGVATGALEKPHRSGWRPLLQCEFDMAYSPLMELPYGKGQVVWSNLDLEDHFAQDVVAATMAERLIRYMDTLRPLPRTTEIILLGTAKDAALLDDLGLVYRKNDKITEKAGLLLVGDIDALQQEAVTAFARSGGKVLVLPRTAPGQFLGAQFEMSTAFNGGYHIPRWTEAAGLSVSDTRYRTACSSIVVKGGVDETGANGLLGKKSLGKGSILFAQFDPNRFNADSVTYFRYTRWRQTRALAQVLSNLGATFLMDKAIFEQAEPTYSVLLDGMWKAVVTKPVPAAKEATLKHKDPGISEKALSYIKPDADEKGMVELPSGAPFEQATTAWAELDGEIVYRKTIDVPAALVGKELQLILGLIDDYDEVFINGISVGKTGVEMEPVWSYNRTYTVPPGVVKAGKNVMAIRIWDTYGGGGLMNGTKARELKPANQKVQGLYHSDYIDDFAMGDDPFRYFRW